MYKGFVFVVYHNQFEMWKDEKLIAEFIYNSRKPLMPQIQEAMEM